MTAIYGAVKMIDEKGGEVGLFVPAEFDRRALMRCELVPPMSTTYFDRRRCGDELRGDASSRQARTSSCCCAFPAEIVRSTAVLGATRLSYKSMTRNPENYERFCTEKIAALRQFVDTHPDLEGERVAAVAGIYCWAAESILEIEGPGPRFASFVRRARGARPRRRAAATARGPGPTKSARPQTRIKTIVIG